MHRVARVAWLMLPLVGCAPWHAALPNDLPGVHPGSTRPLGELAPDPAISDLDARPRPRAQDSPRVVRSEATDTAAKAEVASPAPRDVPPPGELPRPQSPADPSTSTVTGLLEAPPLPSRNLPTAAQAPVNELVTAGSPSGIGPLGSNRHQEPRATLDQAVNRTGLELNQASKETPERSVANPGEPATQIVARVGETIITQQELKQALARRVKGDPNWQKMPYDQQVEVVKDVLEYMINRAMIVQAARRELSKPKQWDAIQEEVEKHWTKQELPTHLKRYNVHSEPELRKRLEERGDSLDDLKLSFQFDTIAMMYTAEKLRNKVPRITARETYPYYRANLAKFQRPAQVTWREIYYSIDEQHSRADALREIEAAQGKLRGSDDFSRVAAESRSPRAHQGGKWETTLDGSASMEVNKSLETLPIGQLSPILEDSRGFYLVKVEAMRPAGPTPFEEVEGKISEALLQSERAKAMDTFLADLRARTPIRSFMIESQARSSDPAAMRSSVDTRE